MSDAEKARQKALAWMLVPYGALLLIAIGMVGHRTGNFFNDVGIVVLGLIIGAALLPAYIISGVIFTILHKSKGEIVPSVIVGNILGLSITGISTYVILKMCQS